MTTDLAGRENVPSITSGRTAAEQVEQVQAGNHQASLPASAAINEPRGCPCPGACSALVEIERLREDAERLDWLNEFLKSQLETGWNIRKSIDVSRRKP